MYTYGPNGLLRSEPVQWAVDYLGGLLEILDEQSVNIGYGSALLALEGAELRQVPQKLAEGRGNKRRAVFIAFGLTGARLFVARQITAALPPVGLCRLYDSKTVYSSIRARLADELAFFQGFRLPLTEKPPSPSVVNRALAVTAGSGMLGRLNLAGSRLHIYCLDYTLPAPAYYLYRTHSILCGASDLDDSQKLHCLLHELGHVIHAALTAGRPPQADPELRRGEAERFAHRFARRLLTGC